MTSLSIAGETTEQVPEKITIGGVQIEYSRSKKIVSVLSSDPNEDPKEYEDATLIVADSGVDELGCIVSLEGCIRLPDLKPFLIPKGEVFVSVDIHEPSGDLILRTKDAHSYVSFYSMRHNMCIYRRTGWAYYHENHPATGEPSFSTMLPQKSIGPNLDQWMHNPQEFRASIVQAQGLFRGTIGNLFRGKGSDSKEKVVA